MATPTVQVNVRVPLELHAQIVAEASKSGGTVSSIVMLAVRELLARPTKGSKQ